MTSQTDNPAAVSTFIDISDFIIFARHRNFVSGIQRVIFTLSRELIKQKPAGENIYFSFQKPGTRQYVCVSADFLPDMPHFNAKTLLGRLGMRESGDEDRPPAFFKKYASNPIKRFYHLRRFDRYARLELEGQFLRRKSSIAEWRKYRGIAPTAVQTAPAIHTPVRDLAKPGDRFLLMDANWNNVEALNAIEEISASGVKCFVLVHDMISIMQPRWFETQIPNIMLEWLRRTTKFCTHYLAVSQSTQKDLQSLLAQLNCTTPVDVVPLAQELETAQAQTPASPIERISFWDGIRPEIMALTRTPYVLCVGTQEIRKNNWGLAQAWKNMLNDTSIEPPRLVFAGKPGWMNTDFFDWMKASGNLNGWVQFADGPSEQELAFLYQHCEFTAFTSFYEGWGLPVGESLSFGKTVLLADNSSLPEVGADLVEYCKAGSIFSIETAARRLIQDQDHRQNLEQRIRKAKLRSWSDAARDLATKLASN